jgi:hypothetical protein
MRGIPPEVYERSRVGEPLVGAPKSGASARGAPGLNPAARKA